MSRNSYFKFLYLTNLDALDRYLQSLHAYLLSFTKRTQPLVDVDDEQALAEAAFNRLWDEGQLTEWADKEDVKMENGNGVGEQGVWCSACKLLFSLSSCLERTKWLNDISLYFE